MKVRLLVLAALLTVAVGVGVDAFWRVDRELEVDAVCSAVERGDHAQALASSEALLGDDPSGLRAAECRCFALLATEQAAACDDLLIDRLARSPGWVPHAALARRAVRAKRDRGDLEGAASYARSALEARPDDLHLVHLDLALQSALQGESAALREAERTLSAGAGSYPTRIVLAARLRRAGDATSALRVLGDEPPEAGSALQTPWFDQYTAALADRGDAGAVRAAFVRWESAGGNPVELRARFALRVSTAQLVASANASALLRASLAEREALEPELVQALFERLISHQVAEGRIEEALAVYDAAVQEVALPALSRDQLVRRADRGHVSDTAASGELVFAFPDGFSGTLRVSPEPTAPLDSGYEVFAVSGTAPVRVARQPSDWPVRWVVRDQNGALRASGGAWAIAGQPTRVQVALRSALEAAPAAEFARRAADGRTRVFAVVLDCADWRIAQYLRERGELPFLDFALRTGHRAVLDSDPPLTAAAMESLVWPERGSHVSFLGVLHQLGVEAAGLASVGRNPLDFLAAVLPETPNFFDTIGAGDLVAANMLFSHGAIDAGRHAELVGPSGARRLAEQAPGVRMLDASERARYPGLASDARVRSRVETIASEFDVAEAMARAGDVDLLLLRIESLDILTHALYVELERGAQDDGDATLLSVYRYVDERLARLDAALGEEDVLVIFSDHGIRNPLEHDRHALFVASGGSIEPGRSDGTPALRGVPRALADLVGVSTHWDDTGVLPAREQRSVLAFGGSRD